MPTEGPFIICYGGDASASNDDSIPVVYINEDQAKQIREILLASKISSSAISSELPPNAVLPRGIGRVDVVNFGTDLKTSTKVLPELQKKKAIVDSNSETKSEEVTVASVQTRKRSRSNTTSQPQSSSSESLGSVHEQLTAGSRDIEGAGENPIKKQTKEQKQKEEEEEEEWQG